MQFRFPSPSHLINYFTLYHRRICALTSFSHSHYWGRSFQSVYHPNCLNHFQPLEYIESRIFDELPTKLNFSQGCILSSIFNIFRIQFYISALNIQKYKSWKSCSSSWKYITSSCVTCHFQTPAYIIILVIDEIRDWCSGPSKG